MIDTTLVLNVIVVIATLTVTIISIIPSLKQTGNKEVVRYLQDNIRAITKEKDDLAEEKDELLKRIISLENRVNDLEKALRQKIDENTQQRHEIGVFTKLLSQKNPPDKPQEKKRVLFVSSNPINASPLNTGIEARTIEDILRNSGYELKAIQATRSSDITQAILDYKPDILHFSGHGLNGAIALEDKDQKAKLINLASIARLLKGSPVTGILLNACYSAENQRVLLPVSDWVIGMNQPIEDSAAINFSDGFYRALASGRGIDIAFDFGIANAGMENIAQADIPVLVKR